MRTEREQGPHHEKPHGKDFGFYAEGWGKPLKGFEPRRELT